MTTTGQDWAPELVPQSFWDMIAAGEGDLEKFEAETRKLSREQLREMFDQYQSLAHSLLTDEHLAMLGPDPSDDEWMDVASWVVMQGQDVYWDVFEDPAKTPSRDRVRGPSFDSVLVRTFGERFGEWI